MNCVSFYKKSKITPAKAIDIFWRLLELKVTTPLRILSQLLHILKIVSSCLFNYIFLLFINIYMYICKFIFYAFRFVTSVKFFKLNFASKRLYSRLNRAELN